MLSTIPVLGAACVSLLGRDKGKTYIIVKIEGPEFVFVADGTARRMANPKKKRVKHIKLIPHNVSSGLLVKIADKTVKDNELHKWLLTIQTADKSNLVGKPLPADPKQKS